MSNDLCSYGPIVCTCSRSASSDTMMSNNNKAIRFDVTWNQKELYMAG
jgi:hypothetical protein